jgi:hypothetical protein
MFRANEIQESLAEAQRWRLYPGINCSLEYTPEGVILSADFAAEWPHPWQVRCSPVQSADDPTVTEWRAKLRPGFVNGRDTTIPMRREVPAANESGREFVTDEVPLTEFNRPHLVMRWRNPLLPAGVSASLEGEVYTLPGEGYPPYFERLGVRPAALDSREVAPEPDPNRTREIRACDIVLITPRLGSALNYEIENLATSAQSLSIDVRFINDAVRTAPSRYRLIATPKWAPPQEPTALDRLLGTAVTPITDEIRIATVWAVSPPDALPDASPDQTWSCYVQQAVWWNLSHASRGYIDDQRPLQLRMPIPIAAGAADSVIAALLTPLNDAFARIAAFFSSADTKGEFWSI